jgi:hypothetical protein
MKCLWNRINWLTKYKWSYTLKARILWNHLFSVLFNITSDTKKKQFKNLPLHVWGTIYINIACIIRVIFIFKTVTRICVSAIFMTTRNMKDIKRHVFFSKYSTQNLCDICLSMELLQKLFNLHNNTYNFTRLYRSKHPWTTLILMEY